MKVAATFLKILLATYIYIGIGQFVISGFSEVTPLTFAYFVKHGYGLGIISCISGGVDSKVCLHCLHSSDSILSFSKEACGEC